MFENSNKVYQFKSAGGWYNCNDSSGICQILSWSGWNTFKWWEAKVRTPFWIKVFRWTAGWIFNGKLLLRLIRKSPFAIQDTTRFWFGHSFETWFIPGGLQEFMWNRKLWILWRSVDWAERWTWMLVRPYATFEVGFKSFEYRISKCNLSLHKTAYSNCLYDCIFDASGVCGLSFKMKVYSTSYAPPVCANKWMGDDDRLRAEFYIKNQYQCQIMA